MFGERQSSRIYCNAQPSDSCARQYRRERVAAFVNKRHEYAERISEQVNERKKPENDRNRSRD
jgi:hypothetical protein